MSTIKLSKHTAREMGGRGIVLAYVAAMIRTDYDPEADVFLVAFGPEGSKYDGATEVAPGVFVEFDADGNAIGVEVLSVVRRAACAYGQPAEAAAE